jgi:hypothetical protein
MKISQYGSINALQQLLILGDQYNTHGIPSPCWITKHPQRIHYTQEGEEYCFVEVTCRDGVQYGVQAFGDEAVALYIEANKCYMCGVSILLNEYNKDIQPIEETIDEVNYMFDSIGCALVFKKLRSIYGIDFCLNN